MHEAAACTLALLAAAPVVAQSPLGAPPAVSVDRCTADPAGGGPARARWELGREALAAGRLDEAVRHLLAAAELHPASPVILRDLLAASVDDPDSRALFGISLALATCDARGRVQLEREDKELLLPKDGAPRSIASAQAAAIAELARYGTRLRGRDAGDGVLARWAVDLALDLGQDAPYVLDAHRADLDAALAAAQPDAGAVIAALRKLLDPAPTTTESATDAATAPAQLVARDRAIRAARILTGLDAQRRFGDDLEGPPPPALGDAPEQAAAALARLRDAVAAAVGDPWTVEELRALGEADRAQFTASHATWANPGVATSPGGLYTIWTTCGFETLLGAAATVERHHRRLVDWYGTDPFGGRPGTIRIEPESAGLESNGAPFWWAGGFQSGDRTVLRFSWSSIEALGRGLTHELTHRFDGTLYAFLPAWLTEGRAVWTGRSYAEVDDGSFIERYLQPHAIQGPFVKGYGGIAKLGELLDGTIDDYRDNYTAGYALFVYLKTWRGADGELLFAEPLERYMKNARAGRNDPVSFFTDHFADGEGGRPEGLDAFADGFREFMHQCYRWSWGPAERDAANAWIARDYRLEYTRSSEWSAMVRDVPTFSWARNRAEPWFGQGHVLAAGRLLQEAGVTGAAAAALCWSLQVDGWRPENAPACAELLDTLGQADAAWAVRHLAASRIPTLSPPRGEAPMLRKLPRVRALLEALRESAQERAAAGRLLAAAGCAERLNRVARAVGADTLDVAPPAGGASRFPRLANPRVLGLSGWIESGLTGYEERRVPDLWFVSDEGDLHVGRTRPRDATGSMDRAAHQRHAFVRSVEWLAPGRYVVRARVHFTTSYVSGALVFGWTRRDRNLRLTFSAGDFLYAIGRRDSGEPGTTVRLALDALWERDRSLPHDDHPKPHEFDCPGGFLDLELRVDGPTVECHAMGRRVFSYTTPELTAIEGAVGFAVGQGAVRVQNAVRQRLDRGCLQAAGAADAAIQDLVQQPFPGVPAAPHGTLVIWVPRDPDLRYLTAEVRRALQRLAKPMQERDRYPQQWVVMAPPDLLQDARDELDAAIRAVVPEGLQLVTHVRERPPEDQIWVLFVDAFGVLRALGTADVAIPRTVERWARLYRAPVPTAVR